MGVDLILLPIDHESDGWGYSHTVLSLERATALWEPLRLLPGQAVPASFSTYLGPAEDDEPHYGDTQYDAYGERLSCTTVYALRGLGNHPGVTEATRNRAAWAFLGELPPQMRVALYWHWGRGQGMETSLPQLEMVEKLSVVLRLLRDAGAEDVAAHMSVEAGEVIYQGLVHSMQDAAARWRAEQGRTKKEGA